jgi:hypothetical protein
MKLCECGCGGEAPIADHTRRDRGYKAGEPVRFIRGHAMKGRKLSPEQAQRAGAARRGQRNTPEHNRKISEAQLGEKSSNWRGGRIIREGRVLIYVGREHPLADIYGYAYEHRLVMAAELDKRKGRRMFVHHRDLNPRNNDTANLLLLTNSQHTSLHNLLRKGYTADQAEAIVLGEDSPLSPELQEIIAPYRVSGL